MLKEMLRKDFLGKKVLVECVRQGVHVKIGGEVRQDEDGDVYFYTRREQVEGQPIGQDPRTGKLLHAQIVIPESYTYFTDYNNEEICLLTELCETALEAKRALESAPESSIVVPDMKARFVPGR
jgi:hypothetical protein